MFIVDGFFWQSGLCLCLSKDYLSGARQVNNSSDTFVKTVIVCSLLLFCCQH